MERHLIISVIIQAFVLGIPSIHGSGCGKEWILFNGHCYHLNGRIGSAYTWHQANRYCLQKGSHLASIHSEEENRFIAEKGFLSVHPSIWTGLNSLGNDTTHSWTDGSPVDFVRVNISVVDPGRRCAILDSPSPEKRWLFTHCDTDGSVVCKKVPQDTAQTLTPPVTTPWPGSCQQTWTRIGNKCFKIFSSKDGHRVNQSTALQQCKALGLNHNLASIHSENENVILTTLAVNEETNTWLGLSRITFTTFGWTDNSELAYTKWAPGEPSSVAESCVEFVTSKHRAGLWNDISCRPLMGYICQSIPGSYPTEDTPNVEECEKEGFVKLGSSCYKMVLDESKKTSWFKAEANCQEFGGHLASVHSATEIAFIRAQLQSNGLQDRLWIGLNSDQRSTLHWSDGWPVTFFNLGSSLSKGPSQCASQNTSGQWTFGPCQTELGYICKITNESPPDFPQFDSRPCPKHVPDWFDVGLEHCFSISTDYAGWGGASLECLKNDSNLASFHTRHELELLAPYISMSQRSFWIGKYRKHTGLFEWIDGSESPVLDLWESGEPSTKAQDDCMDLNPVSLSARAKKCEDSAKFICKIPKV